ncbi:MAG: hypothetical protein A2086_06545 [Spirochaetes bacterium GWD1_27_9]|nr:MAG: hypothetical protein A2086_06545 [Spirochaetes bacterium GWD1_27_9]
MKIFDFNEQLPIGKTGELIFSQIYKNLNIKLSEDKRWDFELGDKIKIELKTDTYNMEATENFFMELYSDSDKGTLGGPWRALSDGVEYFVYFYISNGTFFWFKTQELCNALENIIAQFNLKLKAISNKGWTTQGYLINRDLLKNVICQLDVVPSNEPKTDPDDSNPPF